LQKSADAHQEKRVNVKLRGNQLSEPRNGRQIHWFYVDLHMGSITQGNQKSSPKLANDLDRDMARPRGGARTTVSGLTRFDWSQVEENSHV